MDLPTFDLSTIVCATDQFSSSNELGKGGYGPVYKGVLANGTEIAVKRLSKNSDQGLQEFKTEVQLIAKLQHRNLMRQKWRSQYSGQQRTQLECQGRNSRGNHQLDQLLPHQPANLFSLPLIMSPFDSSPLVVEPCRYSQQKTTLP
ncbi:hypothetical protein AHAS_Ahas18G0123200 [Arachis hypogaea]